MTKKFLWCFLICCSLISVLTVAEGMNSYASQICWTTGGWGGGQVYRANIDGTDSEMIMSSPESAYIGITWDNSIHHVFTAGEGMIQRADLNGANQMQLVSGNWYSEGIALHSEAGKMYWTTFDGPFVQEMNGTLQRSDFDGTHVEVLFSSNARLNGLALDTSNQKIYWTQGDEWDTWRIYRANMDMTGIVSIVDGTETLGIALDTINGKLYWTDWARGTVSRSNLDGSAIEELYSTPDGHPHSIALDPGEDKMYWTEWDTDVIMSANLDGSGVETLIDTATRPMGIAIVNPVPVPAAAWLLASGLLPLAGLRHRNKG